MTSWNRASHGNCWVIDLLGEAEKKPRDGDISVIEEMHIKRALVGGYSSASSHREPQNLCLSLPGCMMTRNDQSTLQGHKFDASLRDWTHLIDFFPK